MAITRTNPDIGYIDPARMEAMGVSQVVVAAGAVHWSGIVGVSTDGTTSTRHSPGDAGAQLEHVLGTLDKCLESAGTDRTRIVALTMFTTDVEGLGKALGPVFAPWAGEHRPTVTVIGVDRLAYPELALEVQGFALLSD